jgi:hypothetical protein
MNECSNGYHNTTYTPDTKEEVRLEWVNKHIHSASLHSRYGALPLYSPHREEQFKETVP